MRFTVTRSDTNLCRSGVHLGAIGTGGAELLPDGRFIGCSIFNHPMKRPDLDLVMCWMDGDRWHQLRLTERLHTGMGTMLDPVEAIEYDGNWPEVTLRFPGLPVSVHFQVYCVPGDLAESSIPAIRITAQGTGRFVLMLSPPVGGLFEKRGNRGWLTAKNGDIGFDLREGWVGAAGEGMAETMLMMCTEGGNGVPEWMLPGHHLDRREVPDPFDRPTVLMAGAGDHGKAFTFDAVLAWCFPDATDWLGRRLGRHYANRFFSCRMVMDHVRKHQDHLQVQTAAFVARIREKLPEPAAEAYLCQLSALTRQGVLAQDGRFGVWEGGDHICGLNTIDVAYYGSWLYAQLWPELERSAMRQSLKFISPLGEAPHALQPDFAWFDAYERRDMNAQAVLMLVRDWILGSRDEPWRREMFPMVKRLLTCGLAWDTDGDGVPEADGQGMQTFDAWGWKGCSSFLGSLWAGAWRAGAVMAEASDDRAFARQAEEQVARIRETMRKKLWNGSRFIIWRNDTDHDPGSLLDGLSGDWYLRTMGLKPVFSDEEAKSHLRECWRMGRVPIDRSYQRWVTFPGERGHCYLNGSYEDGRRVTGQQYEPWTGMEYAYASHLLTLGMEKECWQVVEDVHQRKFLGGGAWRHTECGHYYFRPMVMGVFTAVAHGDWQPPQAVAADVRHIPVAKKTKQLEVVGGMMVNPAGVG